jgi:hypothetical protein
MAIQQEFVTLKHWDQCLGFYWPHGFDHVMIGSIAWNPQIKQYEFEGHKKPELYSIEEAHEIFNDLIKSGAY